MKFCRSRHTKVPLGEASWKGERTRPSGSWTMYGLCCTLKRCAFTVALFGFMSGTWSHGCCVGDFNPTLPLIFKIRVFPICSRACTIEIPTLPQKMSYRRYTLFLCRLTLFTEGVRHQHQILLIALFVRWHYAMPNTGQRSVHRAFNGRCLG